MSSQNPGCLAALFGIVRISQSRVQQYPYMAKQFFFSNAEASFYHFLKRLLQENPLIFPHVTLRDLVSVSGVPKSEFYKYHNQIDRKQVDFLLVNTNDLKPLLVIELDDSTNQRQDRVERDRFVEKVLAVAQIPIVRIPVRNSYDANEISDMIKQKLQKTPN